MASVLNVSAVREGFVPVPGGRVWYQVLGAGSAMPLIALHGGPGYPSDYLAPLAGLADERPVVFYDQLGCGRSERPDDPALWRAERFVEELAAIRRELGLERIHLLGHSWGSMLATDYGLTGPAGIVGLVLASPPLSIPRWLADAGEYRRALPPEIQGTLERHETAGTTDSSEYEAATMVYYRRHVCRMDPWPEPLQRAVAGLERVVNFLKGFDARWPFLGGTPSAMADDRATARPRAGPGTDRGPGLGPPTASRAAEGSAPPSKVHNSL